MIAFALPRVATAKLCPAFSCVIQALPGSLRSRRYSSICPKAPTAEPPVSIKKTTSTPQVLTDSSSAKAGGASTSVSDKSEAKRLCVKHTETRDGTRFSIDSPLGGIMGKRLFSQDALYNDLTMGDKPIVVHETMLPGFECLGHTHSPD